MHLKLLPKFVKKQRDPERYTSRYKGGKTMECSEMVKARYDSQRSSSTVLPDLFFMLFYFSALCSF